MTNWEKYYNFYHRQIISSLYIVSLCVSKLKFEMEMISPIEKWAEDMNRWKTEKNPANDP